MSDILEYDDMEMLDGDEGLSIKIPSDIIFDSGENPKIITAFSYFSAWRAFNGRVNYSVNDIVEWTNRIPTRRKGGIDNQMFDAVGYLSDMGYIEIDDAPSGSKRAIAKVNGVEYDSFSIIYLDEISKVFSYEDQNKSDKRFNTDILFMIFAYLRWKIPKRKNNILNDVLLNGSDGKIDIKASIENSRTNMPEAYDCYYKDIADNLGISERLVSKCADILMELGLIYHKNPNHYNSGSKWVTTTTIFCNFYKRYGRYLADCGDDYINREIANKENGIFEFTKKSKRRNMKKD